MAAATHTDPWLGAMVIVAGGLSVLYAARFQLVAYGRPQTDVVAQQPESPATSVRRQPGAIAALSILALATVVLGVIRSGWGEELLLDITGGHLSSTDDLGAGGSHRHHRLRRVRGRGRRPAGPARGAGDHRVPRCRQRLDGHPGADPARGRGPRPAHSPVRLPGSTTVVVDAGARGRRRRRPPSVRRARHRRRPGGRRRRPRRRPRSPSGWPACADRVGEWTFDGAVEGLARLTGAAGRDGRRLQSGQTHHYYVGIVAGLALLVLASVLWR